MKRSEINRAIREMEELIRRNGLALPPFCHYSPEQWRNLGHRHDEIRDARLGWDITDYGLGRFSEVGFALITLRNGKAGDPRYPKAYAEKLLMLSPGQTAPMHYHFHKTEDIINRGGGDLVLTLFQATPDGQYSGDPFTVSCDGVATSLNPGDRVTLVPGESITLPPYLYHDFQVRPGTNAVLIGEVSSVNDDETDNRFRDPIGRFPAIAEDEPPYRLLCTEYPPAME